MSKEESATAAGLPVEVELKPIVGTSTARFLNQYNTYHDKPLVRPTLNDGVYLDPDLTRILEEERRAQVFQQHHKHKDWVKSYMDECVKFQSITKGRKS